jgi:DNA invertase Pin-like site-specific DNA recombinase
MTGKFIAYYRVSTQKQGNSGLGLEAQRKAVTDYLNGGRWKLVAELTEVETGKRNDRPQLTRALALCRVHRATLIIAKLDRLARNVAFISNLMEAVWTLCAATCRPPTSSPSMCWPRSPKPRRK